MKISVEQLSDNIDEWDGVADAIEHGGALLVLAHIDGDEVSGDTKVFEVTHEIEQPVPNDGKFRTPVTATKTETFQLVAIYAPGMWMKVEYLHA